MVQRNVLILKAGYSEVLYHESQSRYASLGDVLRTTPILHLFEEDNVTWATDPNVFPILEHNPLIRRLVKLDWITEKQLRAEHFDVLVNLEGIPGICVLAEEIHANRRYGFKPRMVEGRIDEVEAYQGSESILQGLHRAKNKKSVQELLFEMLGAKWKGEEYVLGYQPKKTVDFDVVLNPISGNRWPTKSWPIESWNELEELLLAEGFKVGRQDKGDRPIIREDLRAYMDWLNSSKLIIANDTLGLHLGIALKKQVLGLFGPTSIDEVYFYGRGKGLSLQPTLECMPCYAPTCSYSQDRFCMTQIKPEQVFEEAKNLMKK